MLTILDLGNDPFERGKAHGSLLTQSIEANLATYLKRFEAGGRSAGDARAEGRKWVSVINDQNQDYGREMAGIAHGSGIGIADIAMLNARYEIAFTLFGEEAKAADPGVSSGPGTGETDGCTSFGALGDATASGHVILGQNWDWLAGLHGHCAILRVRRDAGPDFISYNEAGIVGGKQGLNSAGIGLVENGLVSDHDGRNGFEKPFHLRCREVVEAESYDLALAPILQTRRVCSANFVVGQAGTGGAMPGQIINIETSPDAASYHYPVDGLVTHANHFLDPRHGPSQMEKIGASTLYRAERLDRLLRKHLGRLDAGTIAAALSDHFGHPNAICRHPDGRQPEAKRTMTNGAMILDLDARVMHVADGPPCENDFVAYALGSGAVSAAAE